MRKQYMAGLLGLTGVCVLLAGCGGRKDLTDTSVLIRSDGTIVSAIYEEFDENAYSKEDLEAFITEAVSAYNMDAVGIAESKDDESDSALAIVLDSIEYKDGKAVLKLEYASAKDYLKFNEAEGSLKQLACGTVGGAKEAGIDISGLTLKSADGNELVSGESLSDDMHVVFAQGRETIVTQKDIVYVSEDVTLKGADTAVLEDDDSVKCIVFKK